MLSSSLAAMVAGCGEPPSFTVRWVVEDADRSGDFPPLSSPRQCSKLGIGSLDIETYTAITDPPTLIDVRSRSCFPTSFDDPEAVAHGPALPDGVYDVVLRAVRRDGVPWSEAGPEACDSATTVACTEIEVADAEPVEIRGLRLGAPPQCNDGVDNDGDGLVDRTDPACDAGEVREGADFEFVQVRLGTSLLNHNCNATCAGLGLSRVVVNLAREMDGERVVEQLGTIACREARSAPQFFAPTIERQDPAWLEVHGVDAGGNRITKIERFEMGPEQNSVAVEVDFADSDFLEPIDARIQFAFQFFGEYGAGVSSCRFANRADRFGGCAAPAGQGLGDLVIDQVRVRALDAHGAPLASPPALSSADASLDGTPLACPNAAITTEALTWGGYLLEVEALSAEGEVCFETTEPVPAGPDEAFTIRPERVIPPPPSCRDCGRDEDCGVNEGMPLGTCVDGVCVAN